MNSEDECKQIIDCLFLCCRLCISEKGKFVVVPNSEVHKSIKEIFNVQIDPFDGLSQLVCDLCQEKLKEILKLRSAYTKNQDILKFLKESQNEQQPKEQQAQSFSETACTSDILVSSKTSNDEYNEDSNEIKVEKTSHNNAEVETSQPAAANEFTDIAVAIKQEINNSDTESIHADPESLEAAPDEIHQLKEIKQEPNTPGYDGDSTIETGFRKEQVAYDEINKDIKTKKRRSIKVTNKQQKKSSPYTYNKKRTRKKLNCIDSFNDLLNFSSLLDDDEKGRASPDHNDEESNETISQNDNVQSNCKSSSEPNDLNDHTDKCSDTVEKCNSYARETSMDDMDCSMDDMDCDTFSDAGAENAESENVGSGVINFNNLNCKNIKPTEKCKKKENNNEATKQSNDSSEWLKVFHKTGSKDRKTLDNVKSNTTKTLKNLNANTTITPNNVNENTTKTPNNVNENSAKKPNNVNEIKAKTPNNVNDNTTKTLDNVNVNTNKTLDAKTTTEVTENNAVRPEGVPVIVNTTTLTQTPKDSVSVYMDLDESDTMYSIRTPTIECPVDFFKRIMLKESIHLKFEKQSQDAIAISCFKRSYYGFEYMVSLAVEDDKIYLEVNKNKEFIQLSQERPYIQWLVLCSLREPKIKSLIEAFAKRLAVNVNFVERFIKILQSITGNVKTDHVLMEAPQKLFF